MPKYEVYDPKLDRLYNKSIRCPYCKAKILKYTTACQRCGVEKKQIAYASNARAKEIKKQKTGEKVFMTSQRPDDVSFTKMVLWLLLGLFGAHNFYVGRKIRGWIMVGLMVTGIIFFIIFPFQVDAEGATTMHSARQAFEDKGIIFPTDFLPVAAFIIWVIDIFAVVFGFYKYPVRLAESSNTVKKGKPVK